MDTHSMIFVAVDKLVSPSSSVDGDQLDEFPNHWQPRFSAQFLLRRTSEGGTGPPPPNRISVRSRLLKPGVCCLARVTYETRCFLIRRASISRVTNRLDDPRFCWSRDRLVAQLFFGSNPVLDIFSVFAAALKIQLMSPASDLFSRWFSESNHCNLLVLLSGRGRSSYRPPYMRRGLLAVRGDADLYLLRLRLLALRHMQAQDPIAILGPNALGADRVR